MADLAKIQAPGHNAIMVQCAEIRRRILENETDDTVAAYADVQFRNLSES